jgi:CDP-diacylglycerol---glycerol-3-phosphate 3-phosphatidyltransferase
MGSVRMNLPNKLTTARLVLTAVFVLVFDLPLASRVSLALLIFVTAVITDYLDGEIARRHKLETDFGRLMDPLADKILMSAALVLACADLRVIPSWAVVLVLTREFLVTGIRLLAISKGAVIAAEQLGKHKTAWQMITVIYFLMAEASHEPLLGWLAPLFAWKWFSPPVFGVFCIVMMVGLTVISGMSYFWKNRSLLHTA